ncbi:NTP transferase domain-containing protein [Pseudoalteromonas denitrificans]|uniref:Choline kinase n=1 Tax=Pseudoalteromonas denitrificans DSM 6059 TaxID=1123010 RepID=A0A1I1KUP4_9GAMM|nr:phosphocholine cytidylyltransferase family protein [Pseudoalteromonas denitrificans]SFC64526.1 Choline kinase [Pseudoalteromonas denitrificans DSM 6059]
MKVIIMAAGVGSRISRHLKDHPKCCVDINGKPLIQHTMELLNSQGITDIAIISGYHDDYLQNVLKDFEYKRIFNPFFRVTNSLASLWFAQEFLDSDEDVIFMNGDVFFEKEILDILKETELSPLMLADSTRIEDADYRFTWQDNKLTAFGKELTNAQTTGEYVGIGKFNALDAKKLITKVNSLVNSEQYNMWWEDAIYRQIDNGQIIHIHDVKGYFWAEVDYIEDYERIIAYLA